MSVLAMQQIRVYCDMNLMLHPCKEKFKVGTMSGGLGPASYDVCLAQDIILWPFLFKLASTEEKFNMPSNICAVVHDKSTWARRGMWVRNTFIDPGWSGYLTLELGIQKLWPMKIKKGTPIAQIVFHELSIPTEVPYRGKYQDQEAGPVKPR